MSYVSAVLVVPTTVDLEALGVTQSSRTEIIYGLA